MRLLWTAFGPCPDVHLSTVCLWEEYSSCLGDTESSDLHTICLEDGGSEASLPRRKTLGAYAHNSLGGKCFGDFAAMARALDAYPHNLLGGKGSSGTFEPPTRLNCDEALTWQSAWIMQCGCCPMVCPGRNPSWVVRFLLCSL